MMQDGSLVVDCKPVYKLSSFFFFEGNFFIVICLNFLGGAL